MIINHPSTAATARPSVAAVTLMCSQAHPQTCSHLLRGLSEVQLIIEELSEGAKPCGLTEEAIRAAVMYPLSSTTIAVRDSFLVDVTLYIKVTTIHQREDRSCS